MSMHTTHTPARILLSVAALGLGLGALTGCRGEREDAPPRQFFPDMDDSPKWEPQGQSEFFVDGRMMRVPPSGTVAFGRQGFVPEDDWAEKFAGQRADLLKDDGVFYTGKGSDGVFIAKASIRFTREDLLRGQERFNIMCASCHNYNGDGAGTVGAQWSYTLPNFHDEKYRVPTTDQGRDGYLFHVVRNGIVGPDGANKMPGYAHALSYDDSWRIVAYIRALQASRLGTLEDVPEANRADVQRAWSAMPGGGPGGGSGGSGTTTPAGGTQ